MKKEINWKKYVEVAMALMGVLGSIATIPTLLKVWVVHPQHAGGQSAITWTAYAIICFFWFIYGIAHKLKPVILTNFTYFVLYSCIIAGIFHHHGPTW